ncbi:MAG: DNA primase [bacterium]
MRWDEDTIQSVKDANDVVEFVSQHLPLKKSGSNFKALCPFHQEKTPSFMVNPARQIFHCFGCSTGGDVIRFVMLYEGLPFIEAVTKLAGRAGIELPSTGTGERPDREEKDQLYRANRIAAGFFNDMLMKDRVGEQARNYLGSRGIHSEACRTYGIGYALDEWRTLAPLLKKEGLSLKVSVGSGLLVQSGDKDPYDRFRNRIMFPIRDLSGRVLGFGGRVLDETLPKYVNTPETTIYHKGDSLFGIDIAAPYIREAEEVLLVEGYLDVIALHQTGMGNVVGVLGTALTQQQARRIRRLTTNCVLLFDGDEAGRKAVMRSGKILLEEGFRCRVAPLEPGEDPDSYLQKKGSEDLLEKTAQALPIVSFVLKDAKEQFGEEGVGDRLKVLDAIVPYLAKIKDRVVLGLYLKEIGDELRIEQGDLRARLTSVKSRDQRRLKHEQEPGPRLHRREELLVHIMVRDPVAAQKVKEQISPDDLGSPELSKIVEKIFSGVTFDNLISSIDDRMKDLISGWALEDPVEGTDRALDDCLSWFAKRKLENSIQETKVKLQEAEKKGDEKEFGKLTRKWQELIKLMREQKKTGAPTEDNGPATSPGGEALE